ncbi:TorD/DmsD family molecular chaperone [Halopiger goleimassiliensis]|uniref:TorD/DmsD family molecular chaperone n=1 Tax=Halopiger goleimassiliensis TaxID=1293048 RepID=UPI0006782732|nr:molecular chaperone TorD family protein [Halopiger goleimassiliensis]
MTDPETHVHRARLYKLASLSFDRPDDELEAALLSGEFAEQVLESAAALEAEALRTHAESVVETAPKDADGVADLYSDWASLFGFEKGGEIQLYQIEYGPGTLVTSTDTLADIAGFYRAFDLEPRDGNRERVDHLCLELEFLSHLALQTAYLDLDGDETGVEVVTNAQADFLEDHLGRWTPRFRDTVHEDSDVAFFEALADLVDALIAADADQFGIEPDVFDEAPPAPTEGLVGDDGGDFRCGTCGSNPSPTGSNQTTPEMPMRGRNEPK